MELKEDTGWFREKILRRFLEYVTIDTTSDRHSENIPSTEGQHRFAEIVKDELSTLGVKDVFLDDNGYLYASLPPSLSVRRSVPPIGFVSHLDTASDAPGKDVKPKVHENYDGNPVVLNEGVVIHPDDSPQLLAYKGKTIITSDGTTLLGADDKAGIAEIVTAFEYFLLHPESHHGTIELVFTPDEETGRGTSKFPMDRLNARFCVTVDGGGDGILEAECFNAYRMTVNIHGKSIHLGDARGRLVNATECAGLFISLLPKNESPQATDGRFGYYAPIEVHGSIEEASIELLIRDFDDRECLRRVKAVEQIGKLCESLYSGVSVLIESEKQYSNMYQYIKKEKRAFRLIREAIEKTGITYTESIIRGGTDGARLSEMGIPTPNLFDGGFNYHSRKEWAALDAMIRASETIIYFIMLWAQES